MATGSVMCFADGYWVIVRFLRRDVLTRRGLVGSRNGLVPRLMIFRGVPTGDPSAASSSKSEFVLYSTTV